MVRYSNSCCRRAKLRFVLVFLAALLLLVPMTAEPAFAELSPAALRKALKRGLKEKDPRQRGRQLEEALAGADSASAADAVISMLLSGKRTQVVVTIGVLSLSRMRSNEALASVAAAASKGKLPRRTRCIEALGRSRHPHAAKALARLMLDPDPRIRTAAARSIGERRSEIVDELAIFLEDPEWTVRSAVIAAMRRSDDREAIPLLCRQLRTEQVGRLFDDLAGALGAITGENYGPDPAAYERWMAAQRGKEVTAAEFDAPGPTLRSPYFATRSRRILFVLSTSETMRDKLTNPQRPDRVEEFVLLAGPDLSDELDRAKTKLDVAQVHLRAMLRGLADGVEFDVMVYSGSPTYIFGELTAANDKTRAKAETRIKSLSAGGGGNLEGALVRTFDRRAKDPLGVRGGPDTVVLLSDGSLDSPGSEDPLEVAPRARRWQRVRQIRFLVLGVGQYDDSVLRMLSAGPPYGVLAGVW